MKNSFVALKLKSAVSVAKISRAKILIMLQNFFHNHKVFIYIKMQRGPQQKEKNQIPDNPAENKKKC